VYSAVTSAYLTACLLTPALPAAIAEDRTGLGRKDQHETWQAAVEVRRWLWCKFSESDTYLHLL